MFKFFAMLFHKFNSSVIKSVDYHEFDGYVYNLSVADDETYIADGIVVHNCRSTTIPKIDPRFDLASRLSGHRPSSGANGSQQVGGNVTYGGWLRTQPAAFQDEVLGRSRGRLLRSGGLTVDSFVDDSGQTYTLDQLRALNPLAFERANL